MGIFKNFFIQFDLGAKRQNKLIELNNELLDENRRLREELAKLKEEVKRLKGIISRQKAQFDILLMKYHQVKGIHFIEKSRSKGQAKGVIMYKYCLMEYLNLRNEILDKDREYTLEESTFVEMFADILEGRGCTTFERNIRHNFIKEYIYNYKNFGKEIEALQDCEKSLSATFAKIDEKDIYKVS